MIVSGTARIIPLIGQPVGQVRSPTVFNQYAQDNGIDAVMFAVDLEPAAAADFFRGLKGWKNCPGCMVTIPHKQAALANADDATGRARRIGAANIVYRDAAGRLTADMMDGQGFVLAMAKNGVTPKGKRVVQVGGGGAGSAIADALADGGAAHLSLIEIDAGRRDRLVDTLRGAYPALELSTEPPPPEEIDILVNASPLGMKAGDSLPFPLDGIRPDTYVCDVVTKPPTTPFLEAALAKGCAVQRGNEMAEAQLPIYLDKLGFPPPPGAPV